MLLQAQTTEEGLILEKKIFGQKNLLTYLSFSLSLCSFVCGFSLICMKEKQRGSERERKSKEPKQRAVDQRKASWQQQP